MTDMPRPLLKFLLRETTRHGRVVWYVRQGAGPRIRLRAEYGTPEFMKEYTHAVGGNATLGAPRVIGLTLSAQL